MAEIAAVTQLLVAWRGGDAAAGERLVEAVYGDLRRLASHLMASERPGHTLDPTALVHEAYLKLIGSEGFGASNRAHFVALVTRMMRNILVDHARAKAAAKRGGDATMVTLGSASDVPSCSQVDVLDLDRALDELEVIDPERCRLVELRWLGGLTVEETAEVMGLAPRTVKRRWRSTRAWLEQRLTTGVAGAQQ